MSNKNTEKKHDAAAPADSTKTAGTPPNVTFVDVEVLPPVTQILITPEPAWRMFSRHALALILPGAFLALVGFIIAVVRPDATWLLLLLPFLLVVALLFRPRNPEPDAVRPGLVNRALQSLFRK
ncbi:hypothetical protein OPIT5_16660 [Opitutaceae bacterium TAV5]|nr:hypothetical protein OPIT5_16660 [Opitutaceae bacterium TAV5]